MRALVLALALAACATTSTLDTRLQTATTGITYAQIAFSAFDAQHETDIANDPANTSRAMIDAKLDAYHAERAKFNVAVGVAVAAMRAVITVRNNQTVAGLEAAAVIVAAELAALGVK